MSALRWVRAVRALRWVRWVGVRQLQMSGPGAGHRHRKEH
jgi:hypothetical protein